MKGEQIFLSLTEVELSKDLKLPRLLDHLFPFCQPGGTLPSENGSKQQWILKCGLEIRGISLPSKSSEQMNKD